MRPTSFSILLNVLIAASLLVPSAAIAPTQAATPPVRTPRPALPDSGVYRTHITVDSPARWARLEDLGIVMLEQSEDSALVLVDGEQLEILAKLRYQPQASDELISLLEAQGEQRAWLRTSMQQVIEKGMAFQVLRIAEGDLNTQAVADVATDLRATLHSLSAEQQAGVVTSISPDSDGDGLTDTEENWWCTDPADPNTDDDANGYNDGEEVAALLDATLSRTVRWNYGPPFGPPAAWPDFNGLDGNPDTPACNDGDYDTIPDYAEAYVVGTRVGTGDSENTDGDKFDDGQEFFGITYCPGGSASCDWGSYPRTQDYSFITSGMPSWIRPPGDSPFVAAYPVIDFLVDPNTIDVTTKEIHTIERTIGNEEHISTGFATTEGNSTSVGTIDTNTHNTWQEHSSTEGGIEPQSYAKDSLLATMNPTSVLNNVSPSLPETGNSKPIQEDSVLCSVSSEGRKYSDTIGQAKRTICESLFDVVRIDHPGRLAAEEIIITPDQEMIVRHIDSLENSSNSLQIEAFIRNKWLGARGVYTKIDALVQLSYDSWTVESLSQPYGADTYPNEEKNGQDDEGPAPEYVSAEYLPQKPGTKYYLPWKKGIELEVASEPAHDGWAWDFLTNPNGVPLVATRSGKIYSYDRHPDNGRCDSSLYDYANWILIDHGDGTASHYRHIRHGGALLGRWETDSWSDIVEKGTVIGYSGDSGYTCPDGTDHLHFQVQEFKNPPTWYDEQQRFRGVFNYVNFKIKFEEYPEMDPNTGDLPNKVTSQNGMSDTCDVRTVESPGSVPPPTLATEQKGISLIEWIGKQWNSLWGSSGGSWSPVAIRSLADYTSGTSDEPINFSDNRLCAQCGGCGGDGGGSGIANFNDGDGGITSLRVWSQTTTNGEGWSTSHSELRTETEYEEITRSEANTLVSSEAWSTATTTDPTDAGQLTFNYNLHNTGSDYAVNISGMKINVLIGDLPVITWNAPDVNDIEPGQSKGPFSGGPITLTLERLAAIDNGEPVRIILADYDYDDNLYDANAWGRSVLFHVDDGIADGDQAFDTFLITTNLIQNETYQDTLARYFPIKVFQGEPDDARNGTITSITTPEFDASGEITEWIEHPVGENAWWELSISTGGETEGVKHFRDMPAKAKTDVYLRYVLDTDGDGFSDKAELAASSDPDNPEIHPRPLPIAAKYTDENGGSAAVQLSLQNNGNYDASSVEVWAVAVDDSITIDDNLIGGGGRVRGGRRVVLGARVGNPDLSTWTTSTSKPYPGGQFEGTSPKTYKFKADANGNIGVNSGLTVSWSDDGEQIWHSLDVGDTYAVNTEVPLSDGVVIAFTDGYISQDETFTFDTALPIDTFSYTINHTPYTPPLIIVSYNDAQGNHKFVSDAEIERIQDDLTPHLRAMRYGFKMNIMSETTYNPGVNTSYVVFNNPTDVSVYDAQIDVEIASIDGAVVKTYNLPGITLLPGPNTIQLDWSTDDFSPAYDPNGEYYVLAFVKDRQGTIFENTVKSLDQLGHDALPQAFIPETVWDFGTAQQGTLLKRSFAVSNIGEHELMTYVEASSGLDISIEGTRYLTAGDVTFYDVMVNTAEIAEGPYTGSVTIRTSDPANPYHTISVQGEITVATPDTPVGEEQLPLDWNAYIEGDHNQGNWVEFTHSLGPDPQTLHPVKVYSADYGTYWGVGKYATDFKQGTAPGDMFGDGRDGTMPSSGNLNNSNGFGVGTVSGNAGSTSVSVQDRYGVARIDSGDVVLIHQTQGSGAGNWEFNRAVSNFTGSGTFTLEEPLEHTYSSGSGNSHAQIMRVPQYSTCNVTGTVTPLETWSGLRGGIFAVMCNETLTVSGSVNANGYGFQGGGPSCYGSECTSGFSGDSHLGSGTMSTQRNGSGGGGGQGDPSIVGGGSGSASGGGGGGHANYGMSGQNGGGTTTAGQGGAPIGNSTLSTMFFGGGGGGGGCGDSDGKPGQAGSAGGGIVLISARNVTISGNVYSNGLNVTSTHNDGGGGGGAGGSIWVRGNNVNVSSSKLYATGGSGGYSDDDGDGGNGSVGRVRIEYCESLSGTTNPAASTQKLDCYITEQIETDPYSSARLNLPEAVTDGQHYWVQYGRRFLFADADEQTAALRIPASIFANANLDALISDVGTGSLTFRLDIGDDGVWDWEVTQEVDDHISLPSPDLAAAFNQYWADHGAALTGDQDVPVRVSLSKGGQVLLTNLRVAPTGSKMRYVRLESGTYDSVSLALTISDGSGPLSVAADVGDDDVVDWTWSGDPTYPVDLTTDDLAQALNDYLSGQTGEVDVPVRFYLAPLASLSLDNINETPTGDIDLRPVDLLADQSTPTEGAVVTLSATLFNDGDRTSGPLTASFYADPPEGFGEVYIGATFISDVPAASSAQASIQWDTMGYSGDIPLRVAADPYNHVEETYEDNNTASSSLTILTRPELNISDITFSDDEPVEGEIITVYMNLQNEGQTAASTFPLLLYAEDPDGIQTQICSLTPIALSESVNTLDCSWMPSAPGPHRLYTNVDEGDFVDESDEGNNQTWQDVYVGFAGPILLDSGGDASTDPGYEPALGYGYLNGIEQTVCGDSADETYRQGEGSDTTIDYQFDHLLPGHYYHLDMTFYLCSGSRNQRVLVDGFEIVPQFTVNDQLQRLSVLLDPALYADNSITVSIEKTGLPAPMINQINLIDIRYCYRDSGGNGEVAYTDAPDGCGWIEGEYVDSGNGVLPYQTVRYNNYPGNVGYQLDMTPDQDYTVNFTFFDGYGTGQVQDVEIDGTTILSGIPLSSDPQYLSVEIPNSLYTDDGTVVVTILDPVSQTPSIAEISLEQKTVPDELSDIALTNNGVDITLTWSDNASFCSYEIFESLSPYLLPEPTNWLATVTDGSNTFVHEGAGNDLDNHFYLIRQISCDGTTYRNVNETGVFKFSLEPGS